MGPYLDSILFVAHQSFVVEYDKVVCLEQGLPDPALSETVPDIWREHGTRPPHLRPRHLLVRRHSDSLRLLIFMDVVAIYLDLQMLTVKY